MENSKKENQLFEAIHSNDLAEVSRLIAEGVDVDTRHQNHYFIGEERELMEWVRLEQSKGRNIKATPRDKIFWTPLMFAIGYEYVEVIRILLAAGADPNLSAGYSGTSLMHAANIGHAEAVTILLNAGADVNATNQYGKTALKIAMDKEHAEVTKILLDAGAKGNMAKSGKILWVFAILALVSFCFFWLVRG